MKDAREKAKELVDKFTEHTKDWFIDRGYVDDKDRAIQCAIDSIDEILEALSYHEWQNRQISDYYRSVKSILQSM